MSRVTEWFFTKASEEHVRREKARARELRASQWWRNELGRRVCHYCGERFEKSELTMDHRVPIVRGGSSAKSNVAVCCKACNSLKKYLTEEEFYLHHGRQPGRSDANY